MSVEVSGAASVDLVADLDQQVRSVVRREGVDPQLEVAACAPDRRGGGARPRRAQPHRRRRPGARPAGRDRRAGRAGLRVRSAAASSSTTPRSRRSGSTSPSRVFVARNGRHELTNVILTRAEVQELVERMLKSSGRRIDLSQPFVDAMLPGRAPAARRARGHQPRLRGRQHPQVRRSRPRGSTTSSASARCRPAPRASSRPPCSPGRTSSSPAARRRARPRC